MKRFVFSSSATVYGVPDEVPLREDMFCKGCTNPYWLDEVHDREDSAGRCDG